MPLQDASAPVLRGGFLQIPLTRGCRTDAKEQAVVRPTQFGTQCVPNWKMQEERPHIPQVALIKAPAEFASQGIGQIGQQPFSISCPRLASLLEFHDVPAKTNPLGIKGVGEGGAIGSPAAVIAAVLDALRRAGVEHIDMPATPNRVWEALRAAP